MAMSDYISMSRLRVDEDRAEDLLAAFRDRAGLVEDFDGFHGLEVWRSDRDGGEVIMVSRWRDRACFTTYMKSTEHKVSHDRIPPDLNKSIKLERLDHLQTFDVVAT